MFGSTISNSYNSYTSTSTAQVSDAVYARVEQVMTSQKAGVDKLNNSLVRDQTKLSALGQLQSALSKFQTVAQGVAGTGLATSASSSAKDVLTATVGNSSKAVPGSYDVSVQQLAQGQVLNSEAVKTATTAIGTGASATIKIEFGTTSGKTFSADGAASKSITIKNGDNTLDGIAAAFKDAGIDAKVVKSGTGYALSINGQSGSAGSMRISVSGDAAIKDLVAYNPAGGSNVTQSTAAQDALLSVNGGATIKSASNTVTTAIDGASLSLTKAGNSKVAVAQDSSQIGANVASLVSAYNSLNTTMQSLQKGDLKFDNALRQAGSEMAQILKSGVNGVPVSALASAGITFDKSGGLQLDQKKLDSAIAADPDAVSKLFTNNGKGIADQFISKVTALTGGSGTISKEVAAVGKDITAINDKRALLSKALTAQATALVNLYSQQEQAGTNSALPGYTGGQTLFDFMA